MVKVSSSDLALFILRLGLGIIFIFHGAQKVFGLFGGPGVEGFSKMLTDLSINPPMFWAWVVALAELISGALLILGVIPRISAGIIAVIMLVAIIKVHGPKGFSVMAGGFEYQFLILIASIALMAAGAGKISLFNKA